MKITFAASQKATSGVVVVPVFNKNSLHGAGKQYWTDSKGQLAAAAKAASFTGEADSSLPVFLPKGSDVAGLFLEGVGEQDDFNAELFAAKVLKQHRTGAHKTITLHLDGLDLTPEEQASAGMGARLAGYHFFNYRTKLPEHSETTVTTLRIIVDDPTKARAAFKQFYGPVSEGQLLARDLVNEPSNTLFPKAYAARLKKMTELGLKVEVLGEKQMTALGMHALVGVGLGSQHESQLVVMKWLGGKKDEEPVCLVGKGITFDTGGISLKPAPGMWNMKADMGGSAAVVGAMHAVALRKAKANVIGIVALSENMPDGKAQNPGDIITSMSGQTIELQSTDAEGRLVLADALWYAKEKFKPRAMVDLATLTGAIIVSLGHEHAGLFTNSDKLASAFEDASKASTEKTWRLPMSPAYDRLLDSPSADMKNSVAGGAGSITAAQFLQRFVGDIPWVHLDIAGTATHKEPSKDPRFPNFASGFGVRLLNQWIADQYES
ncbi:leucyl aminopeptidase [Verrucomicrobiaceae bacterium 5K15]|uniref:Probable cytosol aminopeptidase n=1 Tax=Oceaniferula flava TaxID=2800421 RepID=A0AAE2SC55_9BACT|nr:leucyl aminopeptidase [Oceaniferula flavus]MBK1854312.1 leucyl aminopeptidase [Oceaniferula flavus]MBM1135618.1 leucyl aminopeptidase [Oceaniferula flavus]